jgi:lipopolysaccharide/colanic/teichoic acid biosynthesis glycosyltransferase
MSVLSGCVGRIFLGEIADSSTVFSQLTRRIFPPLVSGVLLSAILAASMSTADSQLLAASSAFASDVYKPVFRKNASDHEMLWAGRYVVLLIAVAALIKLEDGGPVLYKQVRLTKDGREFNMLKFRSMVVSAEQDGVARLSTGDDDPRITRVGRVLRAHRFDELPQLFNVLGGSMSLVGPRPERPEIAAEYERDMPEFALRLQCKAGLTGYAQVYGKYNTTPYDKLQMDLMYMSKPSIVEDLKILFATFTILFKRESTEGVAPGQVNARDGDKPAA